MKGLGNQIDHNRLNNYYKKIMSEAVKHHSKGNISEAKKYYQKLINDGFEDINVFNNYAIILINAGRYKEAEFLIRKSIEINPKDSTAHANLGGILKNFGKLEEAEKSIRKAIELNPHFVDSYLNLGNLLRELRRLKEAELLIREAIRLNPNFDEAYLSLGNILKEMGKLEEAELYTRKAIKLKPNFGSAYLILGIILRCLGKFDESELYTLKAIKFNTSANLALSFRNLSLLLYVKGNVNLALKNIEKASSIDPISKDNQLLLSIFRKRIISEDKEIATHNNAQIQRSKLFSHPIILNRAVEPDLIKSLYEIKAIDLNKFTDPSYGFAKGSDYKLFEDNKEITKKLEKDLIAITEKILNSNVFFRDSFFTILEGESEIIKHNHVGYMDKLLNLNLWKQKYSLVYYLSVGDQDCQNPGIIKFYKDEHDKNSNQEILPSDGMILIFPADRYHSVKYDGNKDRIIIGVNFYVVE